MTLSPIPFEVTSVGRPGARCATQLLRALAAHGVRAAFGIPGASVGPVYDALSDVLDIKLVSTRHETAAVFAAMGHARATGSPAIVLVTSGPGVTNTLTGVACAHHEEIPLIVIGGEVPTSWSGRGALQDGSHMGLDVVSLMRHTTRWSCTIHSPEMASGAAARAWSEATGTRPGPVLLSVPYDVAQAAGAGPMFAPAQRPLPAAPDAMACMTATDLLARAKRPLLVLGSGARNATREAVALAERLAIPVVVTSHAKGIFPERHALYLGLIGNAGHPSAQDYIASRPDVVCVVGSKLGDLATNGWKLPLVGRAATIQIDREPLLIGRNAPVTLGIVGDAATTLEALRRGISPRHRQPVRECATFRTLPWSGPAPTGTLKPQQVVEAIGDAFAGAIFCSDIGEHTGFAQHYLLTNETGRFHCLSGFGSMGSGLGAAIGIQHAKPDETVVVFVGDGGFHMHVGELLTCVERGIGVVFVVFNDGCWSMVDHGFRAVFKRAPNHLPSKVADIAAVARGYGADAHVVDDPAQLEAAVLRGHHRRGVPLVLDVRIDSSESLSRATRSGGLFGVGRLGSAR